MPIGAIYNQNWILFTIVSSKNNNFSNSDKTKIYTAWKLNISEDFLEGEGKNS